MTRLFLSFATGLMLTACSPAPPDDARSADLAVVPGTGADDTASASAPASAEAVLTSAPPPPAAARTAEALDTTSAAQRAEAAAAPAEGLQPLGTTVVSLGSPTEPGLWLKTPLVKAETQGRATNPATGKSSAVTLIPIDGPQTAGSRMSLPALRLIGASLTALTEIEVFAGG